MGGGRLALLSRRKCRRCCVEEMMSSVEQLGRYANCDGSSEVGRVVRICLMTSLSKHFIMIEVSERVN